MALSVQTLDDYTICKEASTHTHIDKLVIILYTIQFISHQLKQLKDQNIVQYKREGKILVYSLTDQSVNDMMMYALRAF